MTAQVQIATTNDDHRFRQLVPEAKLPRVLVLTPFYPTAQEPGQGSFIAEPLARMNGLAECETIAIRPFYRRAAPMAGDQEKWLTYFSIPTNLGLPASGEFLASRLIRNAVEKHRRKPFDLIHAHSALPCGLAAARLSERLSIPFVVSVHGLDAFFMKQAGPVMGSWCKRVVQQVYRSARMVICISEKVRHEVLKEVEARTTVVYNGVDTALFSPGLGTEPSQSVLSVGNLIPTKGHSLLLRAFAQVAPVAQRVTMEIIGNGPERRKLVELANHLEISHKVHFRGHQNREAVADAMRRCLVFALPSEYEGLGCVYLEAMACARPVIACHGQGIDEIVEHGETGMLVAPNDEAALSDSLLALLRDDYRRKRMGESAREVVLKRFALFHQATQLAEIYSRSLE